MPHGASTMRSVWALLALLLGSPGAGGSGAPVEVSWSGPQPCGPQCDAARPSAGFSLLPNVSHHTVYSAAPRLGTYSYNP